MKKLLLSVFLTLAGASVAHADTSVNLGGTFLNGTSSTVNGSLESSREAGRFQDIFEVDFLNQKESGVQKENRIFVTGKANYALTQRNYAFVMGRYEYDEMSQFSNRVLTGVGWGYKLLRTSTTKLSNEVSVGSLTNSDGTSAVIRNSIWLDQKLTTSTRFVNKFLVESGKDIFILNKTSLVYDLTPTLNLSLNHIFKHDKYAAVENNNLTTFAVGINF